jgi:hypothetical protein
VRALCRCRQSHSQNSRWSTTAGFFVILTADYCPMKLGYTMQGLSQVHQRAGAMRTFAAILACVKILLAMPCLMWGLLIGVIGLGPDGAVPLGPRLAGLCVFAGALAAACPFAWVNFPKSYGWIIAALSTLPMGLMIHSVWIWGWPDRNILNAYEIAGMASVGAIFVLFPILSIADLLLSYKLNAQAKT